MSILQVYRKQLPVAHPVVTQDLKRQIHQTELKSLFTYFHRVVIPLARTKDKETIRPGKSLSQNTAELRNRLQSKTCEKYCNCIRFSYQNSDVYRHADAIEFGKRLIALDYVFCDDCRRIMPMDEIRMRRGVGYKVKTPLSCPCCKKRIAYVEVLIRKTKMRQALFSDEGY